MTLPRARPSPLPDLGQRYQAKRSLGEGGFGSVYEALDRVTGQKVAIKSLTRTKAGALAQFKREFRALADVNHPHLVGLRELYEHQGTWLIVMELITGSDLLSWVRGPAANDQGFNELRLRKAFGGIVQGLTGLHSHGLLHRDLKPSNVRVTADGRAVLLDFGLVTLTDPDQQSTQRGAPGTVAYMAPEQAAAQKLTPAADFYALGTSLYEALTGRLPFDEDTPFAMLMRKMQEDPPGARSLNPRVPPDLDWLCSALLNRSAERRPPSQTILQTLLGAEARVPSLPSPPLALSDDAAALRFEGREPELEALARALALTHEGELSMALVEGESGIGKSALLSHFVRKQREAVPQTWVLSGRCYEHERVPYKALDGCMDALAKALAKLPDDLCAALLPRHAGLVAELFPSLRSVKALAVSQVAGAPAEPAARRQGAFRVLGELLGKLAETRPIILVIDDLQWADLESFRLLRALFDNPAPPPILIACTLRLDQELSAELQKEVAELRKGPHTHRLRLRGLEVKCTEDLARSLLGTAAKGALVQQISHESRGHPLLLAELARYAREHGSTAVHLTLDAALGARIEALSPAARNVLEALTVSAAPRSEVFFAKVCGPAGFGDALKHLLAERLVRRNSALDLVPPHDRIRAAVIARMTPTAACDWHRAIAQQLEAEAQGQASERALHWDQAGDAVLACAAYCQAAEVAMSSLAFASAAAHYARALELLGYAEHDNRLSLLTQRARALAALGQSVEAASLFEESALLAEGPERVRLRVWAAQHQIQGADVEGGMQKVRAVLEEIGMPLPRSQPSALARIVWERTRIRLRGTDAKLRNDVTTTDELALGAAADLVFPISWADYGQSSALTMMHVRRALEVGEPCHFARALAQEAIVRTVQGRPEECAPLFARAHSLADDAEDPVSRAFVTLSEGAAAHFSGQLRTALVRSAAAEELLVTSCPGEAWLLTNARMLLGAALFFAGEHRQLAERHATWLAEAEERHDTFAMMAHLGLGMGHVPTLMRDAPGEALEALQRSLAPWRDHPFGFAHFGEMLAASTIAGYERSGAGWSWVNERREQHGRAFLYKAGQPRQLLLFVRANAALMACVHASEPERPALLRAATSAARSIPEVALGCIYREFIQAQVCAIRGERDEALLRARRIHDSSTQLGHAFFGLNASYLLGMLEGGQAGQARREAVLSNLREQGWQDAWRAATLYVPVAKLLEGEGRASRPNLFLGRYRLTAAVATLASQPLCDALDTRTGRTVTLHTLLSASPESQARFKQEFRALQGVHHVNLARLEALFEHEGGLTIVMEQVPETDFLDYVRPGGTLDSERVRSALASALAGLDALHQAGFVHGDLRPANLRMRANGRTLLIGRGLVTPLEAQTRLSMQLSPENMAYVAPEQIDHPNFNTATDIYALGVCLYQALTGQLPFDPLTDKKLLDAKRQSEPVAPAARGVNVPGDLEALCLAMLSRDPKARPSVTQAASQFEGGTSTGTKRTAKISQLPRSAVPRTAHFTGRKHELLLLERALASARDGQRGVVLVSGESGVGKTTLVRHALETLGTAQPEAWLLSSRCYANEQLGYQAFDGAADQLARTLRKLAPGRLAELLPVRANLLTQLFPVLGSVPQIRDASKKGLPAEPSARRRATLEAFVELLTRLARDRLLVFVIDDLQWADTESFALLTALMEESRAEKLIVLATLRPGEARNAAVAAELESLTKLPQVTRLPLDRLGPDEALALARQLLDPGSGEHEIEAMAREGAGHPFFMRELARFAHEAGATGFDLTHALTVRLNRLEPATRELFELIALAARPCPMHVLERAAGLADFDEHLGELLRSEWIQTRGAAQLACSHDRLREVAAASVPAAQAQELYARLAAAFSEEPDCDPTECAALWDAAGDASRAHAAYTQAGDIALAALAFATAERLYARATELATDRQGPSYARLLTQHAHTFVALGRSAEAAALFEEAAQHSPGDEAVRLRVRAAQHQIQSAQFEAGLANAYAVLGELGVPVARGPKGALGRIVWERARLKLRGTGVEAHVHSAPRDKLLLDTIAALAFPTFWADFLPGNALNMYYLRRALSLGDSAHAARALAHEATFCTIQDRTSESLALFARAESLAASCGDPAARAFVYMANAGATLFGGEVAATLDKCAVAEELLVTMCPDEAWLLTNVRIIVGPTLFFAGEHERLAALSGSWLAEAEARQDAFAITALFGLGTGYTALLMRDEAPAALAALDRALLPWRDRPYGFAQYGEMSARFAIHSYMASGEGWRWFVEQRREHDRAFIYKAGPPREFLTYQRALAALSAFFQAPTGERAGLLEVATAAARSRRQTAFGRILHALLQAQLHALDGQLDAALGTARRAHELCVELDQAYLRHNAAYLLGLLEGGQGGKAASEAALCALREQGWKDPMRAATIFVPYARSKS